LHGLVVVVTVADAFSVSEGEVMTQIGHGWRSTQRQYVPDPSEDVRARRDVPAVAEASPRSSHPEPDDDRKDKRERTRLDREFKTAGRIDGDVRAEVRE